MTSTEGPPTPFSPRCVQPRSKQRSKHEVQSLTFYGFLDCDPTQPSFPAPECEVIPLPLKRLPKAARSDRPGGWRRPSAIARIPECTETPSGYLSESYHSDSSVGRLSRVANPRWFLKGDHPPSARHTQRYSKHATSGMALKLPSSKLHRNPRHSSHFDHSPLVPRDQHVKRGDWTNRHSINDFDDLSSRFMLESLSDGLGGGGAGGVGNGQIVLSFDQLSFNERSSNLALHRVSEECLPAAGAKSGKDPELDQRLRQAMQTTAQLHKHFNSLTEDLEKRASRQRLHENCKSSRADQMSRSEQAIPLTSSGSSVTSTNLDRMRQTLDSVSQLRLKPRSRDKLDNHKLTPLKSTPSFREPLLYRQHSAEPGNNSLTIDEKALREMARNGYHNQRPQDIQRIRLQNGTAHRASADGKETNGQEQAGAARKLNIPKLRRLKQSFSNDDTGATSNPDPEPPSDEPEPLPPSLAEFAASLSSLVRQMSCPQNPPPPPPDTASRRRRPQMPVSAITQLQRDITDTPDTPRGISPETRRAGSESPALVT